MKAILYILFFCLFLSCKKNSVDKNVITDTKSVFKVSDSIESFREFKVADSKYINRSDIWKALEDSLLTITPQQYQSLQNLIIGRTIPQLQRLVQVDSLSYRNLTLFYLYRIYKYDRNNNKSLNSVISINPKVLEQAMLLDNNRPDDLPHDAIYVMPILLKDNINTKHMPTTAGAVALAKNYTEDAFIVKQLKNKNAIILGKSNLSEWAYFYCGDCPSGYSAIGGQTFNPYGRQTIDTGGSSSGSGVAVAANFCVAAIGTETSGSILSPSSQNSVVGLKPIIGVLSRSGIIPISSTLDTPGPMTRCVIDNLIVYQSMLGKDNADPASIAVKKDFNIVATLANENKLKGKRLGYFKTLKDSVLYAKALKELSDAGAILIEVESEEVALPNFRKLLNLDMKKDLSHYLKMYADTTIRLKTVYDIMAFNKKDSLLRMPYGQRLFEGIVADSFNKTVYLAIKDTLQSNGRYFFDKLIKRDSLDAILSINNYHAGYAAVAQYPAITVPMGWVY
ncbi:amidase family protein [Aquimarina sp. W85]|uniref:amidase family protein n=1 Tax=Aquimarina rhodophyticola TaxID=3342246 RepID=UPI00366CD1FD